MLSFLQPCIVQVSRFAGILAYVGLGELLLSDLLTSYKVDGWITTGNFMVATKAVVTYPQFILLSR